MGLSAKNGWYDDLGRVYIYYPLEEIQEAMCCGHDKATKMLNELDVVKGVGLIERIKQGLGKPAVIYVKKFTSREIPPRQSRSPDRGKSASLSAEKSQSGPRQNRRLDCDKSAENYINLNQTEKSQPNPSIYPSDRETCKRQIIENIDYEWFRLRYDNNTMAEVDELIEIMADAICSAAEDIRIGAMEIPIVNVRARLLSITATHIEYVLECLHANTSKIKNIHAYLLTALYRAPTTMNHYYQSAVQHDQYGLG